MSRCSCGSVRHLLLTWYTSLKWIMQRAHVSPAIASVTSSTNNACGRCFIFNFVANKEREVVVEVGQGKKVCEGVCVAFVWN